MAREITLIRLSPSSPEQGGEQMLIAVPEASSAPSSSRFTDRARDWLAASTEQLPPPFSGCLAATPKSRSTLCMPPRLRRSFSSIPFCAKEFEKRGVPVFFPPPLAGLGHVGPASEGACSVQNEGASHIPHRQFVRSPAAAYGAALAGSAVTVLLPLGVLRAGNGYGVGALLLSFAAVSAAYRGLAWSAEALPANHLFGRGVGLLLRINAFMQILLLAILSDRTDPSQWALMRRHDPAND